MGRPEATSVQVVDEGLGGRRVGVVTLVPPPGRPATIGAEVLDALEQALATLASRVRAGEIGAVIITGTPGSFAAGADLKLVSRIAERRRAEELARAGHRIVEAIGDLGVPSFAYLTGPALGGGFELALACTYRVASEAAVLSLPETALGLVPGWGGCYLLPRLLGPEAALRVIVDDPARQRRLTAQDALDIGLVDTVQRGSVHGGVHGGDAEQFADGARAWTLEVLAGAIEPSRTDHAGDADAWEDAVSRRRASVDQRRRGGAPAPARALDLVAAARTADREAAFAAEDEALADLIMGDELRAGLYSFDVITRARRAAASPPEHAAPVRRIGILGAGLMASQLATLFAGRLEVPVVLRDLDAARAEAGLSAMRRELESSVAAGRVSAEKAEQIAARVSATDDPAELAGSDLVIEAVVERLDVKQQAFAEIEEIVAESAILATNTSALSVTAMGEHLRHPERLVGLHFFNPVARMPLVEVIRTERTSGRALATALAVAGGSGKTPLSCSDAPGFVVNRLLLRLLAEVLASVEEGTELEVAAGALEPMGLPMGPFQLLQLVGPAVANHVLTSLNAGFGDARFPLSPGLAAIAEAGEPLVQAEGKVTADAPVRPEIARFFGTATDGDAAGVLRRVQLALAEESHHLLDDGVVSSAGDIDAGMILGAGWPWHNGGLTPYLDRVGAAEATGGRFHAPGAASVPPS